MISRSFIKSSFVYSVIGSLPLASGILLLPFYGNSDLLTTEDFGLLAIYIVFADLVRLIFSYSADNYLGLNFIHHSASVEQQQRFIGTTTLFLIFFGLMMTLIFSLAGDFVFSFVFPDKGVAFFPYGFLSVLTGLCAGIFKAYANLMIYRQRPEPFFWSNMLHFFLVVAISVGGLYMFPLSLDGPIWGRFLSAFASMGWAMVYFVRQSRLKYDRSVLDDLIRYSTPLFIYYILYWVVINIDRYFILGILDEKEVAVFDFAVKMTLIIEFLQNGLSAAVNPKVFAIWKKNGDKAEGNIEINRYFNGFTLINQLSMPLVYVAVVLLVPFVVSNEELHRSFSLLPVLMAGMATRVWYYYLITPVYYFKKTKILPVVFTMVALIQMAGTWLLVNLENIEGAAWASFGIKIVQVLIMWLFVRRFYHFSVNPVKFIVFPLFYIVLLMISHFYLTDINLYLLAAGQFVLLILSGWLAFRKEAGAFTLSLFSSGKK